MNNETNKPMVTTTTTTTTTTKKIIRFKNRESLLTQMFANDANLRTIHNMIVMLVIVFLLYTIEDIIKEPAKYEEIYEVILWNVSDLGSVIRIWLMMNMIVLCLHYPLVLFNNFLQYRWLLINNPEKDRQYAGCLHRTILYTIYGCISIFGILIYCTYSVLINDIKLTGSFSLLLEMTRLLMKSHSFFVEKKDLNIGKETLASLISQEHKNIYRSFWSLSSRARFRKFIYYLFAPTLLYRDSYPRTKKIRWICAVNFGLQFILTVLLMLSDVSRFCCQSEKNWHRTTSAQFQIALPNYRLWNNSLLAVFYFFFHAYLNFTAELLRFGDRHYYDDFWNSKSAQEYFRKWNHVVQQWLYVYIFIPIDNRFHNRVLTNLAVFITSALAHEYIIGFTLRFFFPINLIAMIVLTQSVYFMEKFNFIKTMDSFVIESIVSWSIMVAIFIIEWYSRIKCPLPEHLKSWINLPRSFYCVKL
ncbi:LOW QUALITY PROTEIN: sterol O-acyltransferase 1-like [Dermatophagoides farinae]|uniref:LOW QUALITY PROTEIN: sterol O-acyltransferase 1-like n=1 Tax=Dermatophagoides farinae TaxID=6954 RepID=UPI003F5E5B16